MLQTSITSNAAWVTRAADMDALEIAYRLKRMGLSQSELARRLGVSQAVVSNTIHGRVTCHRVAVCIADLLGETIQSLWPGRYEFRPRKPRSAGGILP